MMVNAGQDASAQLQASVEITAKTTVLFLIGKGNNGGDGLVMAHDLVRHTAADARLYLLARRDMPDIPLPGLAEMDLPTAVFASDRDKSQLAQWVGEADVIVDAIFGIGARLPLRGDAADLLRCVRDCLPRTAANAQSRTARPTRPEPRNADSRPFVFAIDCPSGVDCDSGSVDSTAMAADLTITFIAAKRGQFVFPAAGLVGELASIADRAAG